MKKFLILLLCFALFSCGDDDNSSAPAKMLQTIVMTGGEDFLNNVYTFTYDNQKRPVSINRTGYSPGTVTYVYGDNGKVSLATLTGNTPLVFQFFYNDQGKLSSFIANDETTPVVYSGSTANLNSFSLTFGSNGDLQLYGTSAISYDASKSGGFAGVEFDALILAITEGNAPFFASKKAISDITGIDVDYDVVNTYDQDGFVSISNYTGSHQIQLSYFYTN